MSDEDAAIRMSNDELAEAIRVAHEMVEGCGEMFTRHAVLMNHLTQLLAIQRERAADKRGQQ